MDDKEYLSRIIKDCLKESVDEYKDIDYSQFNDWSNGVSKAFGKWYNPNTSDPDSTGIEAGNGKLPHTDGGDIIVYHACHKESLCKTDSKGNIEYNSDGTPMLGGILSDGFSRRYTGRYACCLGTGIYCALTPSCGTAGGSFGDAMVKCILVGGLDKFIIFDDGLRAKYDPGATIEDEFRRYLSPDKLRFLEGRFGSLSSIGRGWSSSRYRVNSFVDSLSGRRFNSLSDDRRIPDADSDIKEEDLLNGTGIRGFVYHDSYGDVVLVRDINALIPYQYRMDRRSDHWHYAIKDKETFDKINNNFDIYWKFSGKYPKTHYYSTPKLGYAIVRDNGGSYLVNARTEEPVLDFPVDSISQPDTLTGTYDFTYRGRQFRIFINGGNPKIRELKKSPTSDEMIPVGFPLSPQMFKGKIRQ